MKIKFLEEYIGEIIDTRTNESTFFKLYPQGVPRPQILLEYKFLKNKKAFIYML
ncbi:hypothetical protein DE167_003060 [Clostridium beijerinckii]|nr:hypothetical protein [Clostridium beijerinckii]CUU48541.1 protein of unknown function [Clostridium beijerinckii]